MSDESSQDSQPIGGREKKERMSAQLSDIKLLQDGYGRTQAATYTSQYSASISATWLGNYNGYTMITQHAMDASAVGNAIDITDV